MDALRRLRIAKLTTTRGIKNNLFIDVISVLNRNMKHAHTIEFDEGNFLATLVVYVIILMGA